MSPPSPDPRWLVPPLAALAYLVMGVVIFLTLPLLALVLAVTWPFDPTRRVTGRVLRVCGASLAFAFPLWRVRVDGAIPPGRNGTSPSRGRAMMRPPMSAPSPVPCSMWHPRSWPIWGNHTAVTLL